MFSLNRTLWLLFILNVALCFSNQLIGPLFPLYLESISASEMEIGLVISLANVAATVLMLISGLLIERIGRKRMLLISVILSAIPPAFIIYLKDWQMVAPFFIIFNVAFSFFIPTRMAIVAENTNPKNRATIFSMMNMALPIAGTIAPTLSGYFVENFGWTLPFQISTAIMAMSLIPTLSLQEKEKPRRQVVKTTSNGSRWNRNHLRFMATLFVLHLALCTGQGSVNTILPIYLKNQIGLSPANIGLFFTGSSILMLATQIPSGKLADRYSRKKLIITFIAPIPILYYAWNLTTNWVILLALYSLAFSIWSMTWPITAALLSDYMPPELFGTAFGLRMTSIRLGFTIGPLIAGYLYSSMGPLSPFIASAGLFLIGIPLALFLKDNNNKSK